MIWRPYVTSWWKRSLRRCGLLDHILSECTFFWVGGGGWDIVLGGWGYVEKYGALFWVGVGDWECVRHYFGWVGWFGKYFVWRWVGHYFGCVGVGGKIFWVGMGDGCVKVDAPFDSAQITCFFQLPVFSNLKATSQSIHNRILV